MEPNKKKIKLTPTEARKKMEWYCAYQERCHSEVREKLFNFGLYTKEVDEIVAYLVSNNFLNEERFAEAYASGKLRIKYWGKNKIKAMLKQKKVSDYSIRKALNEIDGDEYLSILKKAAEKKIKTIKEKNPVRKKFKLISYLVSRGFEGDLVSDVVNRLG